MLAWPKAAFASVFPRPRPTMKAPRPRRHSCLAGLLAMWICVVGGALAAPPQLRYVVIITRHGVRSPTWTAARLAPFASEPWPDWGVSPGYMTPHGRALMQLMGTYYREWLIHEHLLNESGCDDAGRIYIHADTDQRTMETGQALAQSLLPGCVVPIHSAPEGNRDPLFDPIESGTAKADPIVAAEVVRGAVGADSKQFAQAHRTSFQLMERVLAGAGSPKSPIQPPSDITVTATKHGVELSEPFGLASTLSEDFLLEYTDGMEGKDLGWGRVDESVLVQLLELHAVYSELTRRTPYLARVRGSNLLDHVRKSLQQAKSRTAVSGALGPPKTSALIVVGHDTNIANLSGMLGLSWHLGGYPPNETPPGGALIFSLWERADDRHFFIRIEYLAQSLDQMRDSTPLSLNAPPEKEEIASSGCPRPSNSPACPWDAFVDSLEKAIDPQFIVAPPASP